MKYPFKLPKLEYGFADLEPIIDKETMQIHYEKHHGGYVSKLNKALENLKELQDHDLNFLISKWQSLPEKIQLLVRNNGGGHWNHDFFWRLMGPEDKKRSIPKKGLAIKIEKAFGGLNEFKLEFEDKALSLFGSGWVWLVRDKGGKLQIMTTVNQDNPLSHGLEPVLGLDLWEHAYYLKYQNRRIEYVKNWWKVLDWDKVSI